MHGAYLGRASHRAGGKQCAKNVVEADVGAQLGGHGRGHLPESRITLHGKEVFCPHRTEARHATQIVAQQVDDHHIFAAVLRVVAQPFGNLAVFARGAAARRSALHRPRDNAAALAGLVNAEEEFRRERKDVMPWPPMEKGAVINGLARAEPRVVRRGAAWRLDAERRGEVELINVTGADPLVNSGDAAGVFRLFEREIGAEFRLRFGRERWLGRLRFGPQRCEARWLPAHKRPGSLIECVSAIVDTEPGQWLALATGSHRSLGLEACAALVAEKSGGDVTSSNRAVDRIEERWDLGRCAGGAFEQGRQEQLCPGGLGGIARSSFEKHRSRPLLDERVDLSGKGMPQIHAGSISEAPRAKPELTGPSEPT